MKKILLLGSMLLLLSSAFARVPLKKMSRAVAKSGGKEAAKKAMAEQLSVRHFPFLNGPFGLSLAAPPVSAVPEVSAPMGRMSDLSASSLHTHVNSGVSAEASRYREEWFAAQKSIEEFAKTTQVPSFVVFPRDGKIEIVNMREFLVARQTEGVSYAGTYGVASCIGVVIVGRKDGQVVRTGLAHIDAMCDVEKSGAFFYQVLEGAEAADVYLLASQGDAGTALRIIKRLNQVSSNQEQKIGLTYFMDLNGPSTIAVNINTGEVYNQFNIYDDAVQSREEQKKAAKSLPFRTMMRSPLNPSEGMKHIFRKRFENR